VFGHSHFAIGTFFKQIGAEKPFGLKYAIGLADACLVRKNPIEHNTRDLADTRPYGSGWGY
jgi:hypothetical protein